MLQGIVLRIDEGIAVAGAADPIFTRATDGERHIASTSRHYDLGIALLQTGIGIVRGLVDAIGVIADPGSTGRGREETRPVAAGVGDRRTLVIDKLRTGESRSRKQREREQNEKESKIHATTLAGQAALFNSKDRSNALALHTIGTGNARPIIGIGAIKRDHIGLIIWQQDHQGFTVWAPLRSW